jgi:hypothetical protein
MAELIFKKGVTGNVIVFDKSNMGDNDSNIIATISNAGRIEYLQVIPDDVKHEIRRYVKKYY